jgi:hypothetical protein
MPSHVAIADLAWDEDKNADVVIRCNLHGDSHVRVGYLTRCAEGNGYFCPRCGDEQSGWTNLRLRRLLESGSAGDTTWLGVMDVEVFGLRALKVGISTRTLEARYGPALMSVHFACRLPEREAILIENEVHRTHKHGSDRRILLAGMRRGKRWAGDTECYLDRLRESIIDLIRERALQVQSGQYDLARGVASVQFDEAERVVRTATRTKAARTPVVCLDTSQLFPTVTAAASWAGCSQGNLSAVLAGQRKSAGGYRWAKASVDAAAPTIEASSPTIIGSAVVNTTK